MRPVKQQVRLAAFNRHQQVASASIEDEVWERVAFSALTRVQNRVGFSLHRGRRTP